MEKGTRGKGKETIKRKNTLAWVRERSMFISELGRDGRGGTRKQGHTTVLIT